MNQNLHRNFETNAYYSRLQYDCKFHHRLLQYENACSEDPINLRAVRFILLYFIKYFVLATLYLMVREK